MHERIAIIYFIGMLVAFIVVPLILRGCLLEVHPFQKEFYTRSIGRDGMTGLCSSTLVLALVWPLTLIILLAGLVIFAWLVAELWMRVPRRP